MQEQFLDPAAHGHAPIHPPLTLQVLRVILVYTPQHPTAMDGGSV